MREAYLPFARRLVVALSLSLLPVTALQAQGDRPAVTAVPDVPNVAPGRYVWRDDGSASGPVRVLVSIPLQLAFVWRGSALIGVSSVSTGVAGYDTPTGTFPILEKDKDHHSNLYDDAPMPFMLRLTWDGVALHAGKVTGEPASHGCVRLPTAFARKLFDVADVGATVTVVDDVPDFVQQQSAFGTETTQTIGPSPALPVSAAASDRAPAPSAIARDFSAISRIARQVSSRLTTIDWSTSGRIRSHILVVTLLPPAPSTKLASQSVNLRGPPSRNESA